MKNQYFGDVGDYGKYGLLRTFAQNGISIAVNWYLTDNVSDTDGSSDGKFTQYLQDEKNKGKCPEVFAVLYSAVIEQKRRDVSFIENSDVIPSARFFNERLPLIKRISKEERARIRKEWHRRGLRFCAGADLIFLDPDNGLRENLTKSPKMDVKYVLCEEAVDYYNSGGNLVYYCHKGRRSEDKWKEYKKMLLRYLPDACEFGLTFHRGTQRGFIFVVHPRDEKKYLEIADGFLKTSWGNWYSFEPVE